MSLSFLLYAHLLGVLNISTMELDSIICFANELYSTISPSHPSGYFYTDELPTNLPFGIFTLQVRYQQKYFILRQLQSEPQQTDRLLSNSSGSGVLIFVNNFCLALRKQSSVFLYDSHSTLSGKTSRQEIISTKKAIQCVPNQVTIILVLFTSPASYNFKKPT